MNREDMDKRLGEKLNEKILPCVDSLKMEDSRKEAVILEISRRSFLRRILEYEICIPVQAIAASVVLAAVSLYFVIAPVVAKIKPADIEKARIHYEDAGKEG